MKIILIGFMGSGKSSVGKLLSKKLNLQLIEMDKIILKRSGLNNINEIFTIDGELRFREIEIEVSKGLKEIEDAIIVSGGGIVVNKIIIDYLKCNGRNIFIFLDTEFETIGNRLKDDHDRPLFSNIKEVKRLFEIRQPLYKNYADIVIRTDNKSVENITHEVIKRLGNL